MLRMATLTLLLAATTAPAAARHASGAECATTAETAREVLFLHHRSAAARTLTPRLLNPSLPGARATPGNRDIGNIALIEAANGAVETLNQFNLDASTVTFTPTAAAGYRYAYSGLGYDPSAASQGSPLIALGDDDARPLALPFPFPFYGVAY